MKLVLILSILLQLNVALSTVPPHNRPGHCKLQNSTECESYISKRVSRWERTEQDRIEYSCAGNIKSNCLQIISKNLSRFETNNLEDLSSLAISCQLTTTSCLNYIIPKLSKHEKRDPETMRDVAKSCARADAKCVKKACSKKYACSDSDELLRAARSCYKLCN